MAAATAEVAENNAAALIENADVVAMIAAVLAENTAVVASKATSCS